MIAIEEVNSRIQRRNGGGDTDPDEHLVKLAKAGDVNAFDLLMSQHRQRIFRTIFRITKNHEDTEDQVQETFLLAYRALDNFRGDSKFSSWLTRIALNQALICLRRRRHNQVSLDNPISTETDSFERNIREWRPNPEQHYMCTQANETLRMELSRLSEALRSVIVLKHLHEYTAEETALELGISIAAVKSRALRARRRLRDRLGNRPNFMRSEPWMLQAEPN